MFSFHGRLLRLVECPGRVWTRGSRIFSRQPVRVHLKGPAKEAEDSLRHYEELFTKDRTARRKEPQKDEHNQQNTPQAASSLDTDQALRNSIRYKLLSEAKDKERKLLENVKSPKYRHQHQLFVAEGYRIIREALEHGVTPAALYFSRLKLVAALKAAPSQLKLEDVLALSELPLFKAPYKTLQTWSSVTTSPGIIGVFQIPTTTEPASQSSTPTNTLPLTLVLDEMRDPGNLGGVLRTAAAVGAQRVLLLKGCCDPWETKVVRAGCGAHFRLRLTTKLTWDNLPNHLPEDAKIFLADVCRGKNTLGDDDEEEEADVNSDESVDDNVYELDKEGNRVMVDHGYSDPELLKLYQHASLPTLNYDRLGMVDTEGGAVLVIGGEVGISNAAKKFVVDNFGSKVTIPLANGMDSLNAGVASGVILYEMQKQLHEIARKRLKKERHESGS